MPANLENPEVATGLKEFSFHSTPKERECQRTFKLLHNCTHLKCLQSNAQNSPSQASIDVNFELPGVKMYLENAEEPEMNLPTSVGSLVKQESSRKTSTSASLSTSKPLTVWITTNCGKFLKRWNIRPPNLPPEKSVCRSRSNS